MGLTILKKIDVTNVRKEIWPFIISKMLAKHYLTYERLLRQTVPGFLKDLTGMPTSTHIIRHLTSNAEKEAQAKKMLRNCWLNRYIVIVKAKPDFNYKFVKGNKKDTVYCNLLHVFNVKTNVGNK